MVIWCAAIIFVCHNKCASSQVLAWTSSEGHALLPRIAAVWLQPTLLVDTWLAGLLLLFSCKFESGVFGNERVWLMMPADGYLCVNHSSKSEMLC